MQGGGAAPGDPWGVGGRPGDMAAGGHGRRARAALGREKGEEEEDQSNIMLFANKIYSFKI